MTESSEDIVVFRDGKYVGINFFYDGKIYEMLFSYIGLFELQDKINRVCEEIRKEPNE
jgi:hypothetical protein